MQVRVQITSPKINILQSTPIEVDIETFNSSRDSKIWKTFDKSPEGIELKRKQKEIEDGINFVINKGKGITSEQVKKVVQDVCYVEERKKEEDELAALKKAEEEKTV